MYGTGGPLVGSDRVYSLVTYLFGRFCRSESIFEVLLGLLYFVRYVLHIYFGLVWAGQVVQTFAFRIRARQSFGGLFKNNNYYSLTLYGTLYGTLSLSS